MTIDELVHRAGAHELAAGFRAPVRDHEALEGVPIVRDRSALETHALIHTEISEATEAVRNGVPWPMFDTTGQLKMDLHSEAAELADAVIRIAAYFDDRGWNLAECLKLKMVYNEGRSRMHGGKVL